MRKGFLVGAGALLALAAVTATDASACSRRSRACDSYYAPAPVYQYAPPPAYGYAPPAPVYGYAPPPGAYGPPPVSAGYGYAPPGYGDRRWRDCDRGYGDRGYGFRGDGYGYGPAAAYDGYRPAAVWVPVR
jgi:hypothetical protein